MPPSMMPMPSLTPNFLDHADSDRQEVESGIGRKGKGHIGRIVARDKAELDQKDKHDTEHAGTDQHGKDRRDAA